MKCKYCGRKCTSKSGLSLHLKNCETRRLLTCPVCGKECTSKSGLSLHLKNCRQEPKPEPKQEKPREEIDSAPCRRKGFRLFYDEKSNQFAAELNSRTMGTGPSLAATIKNMKSELARAQTKVTVHYVIYCKITDDEEEGIDMEYPFIGGESEDYKGAEEIARRIVRENRNVTVMPKIYKANGNNETLSTILDKSKRHFYNMYKDMLESHQIYSRTRR